MKNLKLVTKLPYWGLKNKQIKGKLIEERKQ